MNVDLLPHEFFAAPNGVVQETTLKRGVLILTYKQDGGVRTTHTTECHDEGSDILQSHKIIFDINNNKKEKANPSR